MRITLANTHDLIGGAERCSYDLARELSKGGDHVDLIVGRKLGDDPFVQALKYRPFDWRLRSFLHGKLGVTDTSLASPLYGCWTVPALRKAEVYNIHNMHGAYWNFWALPVLGRRAPLVLTLHDEWLLTGDCAYTYDCDRFTERCGACPQASEPNPDDRVCIGGGDATRVNHMLKRAMARRLPEHAVELVTPSAWLKSQAERTPHLARFDCSVIPNGVDLGCFAPSDRRAARDRFGLPENEFLVLSLAANQFDRRKNLRVVLDAVRSPEWPSGARLVIAGRLDEALEKGLTANSRCCVVGFLEQRDEIATLFSACDLLVLPSRADNLPYTALEAQGCGCPVLAARVGGIPETIAEGESGWLFEPEITGDALAARIAELSRLGDEHATAARLAARRHAERSFEIGRFVGAYRALFERKIEARRRRA